MGNDDETEDVEVWRSKTPAMKDFLTGFCGRVFGTNPLSGECATCGNPVNPNDFRDEVSRREYEISGMCQQCQDEIFAEGDLGEEDKWDDLTDEDRFT